MSSRPRSSQTRQPSPRTMTSGSSGGSRGALVAVLEPNGITARSRSVHEAPSLPCSGFARSSMVILGLGGRATVQLPGGAGDLGDRRRHSSRLFLGTGEVAVRQPDGDRKSTRLNSSHVAISYAVFCLKKKKKVLRISLQQDIMTDGRDL